MRNKTLGAGLLASLLSVISGCSCMDTKPESYRAGVVFRQVKGRYAIFRDEKIAHLARVQANKELNDKFDSYLRLDFAHGTLDLSLNIIDGHAEGSFQSFGAGLSYYPSDSRNLSLDIGAEIFRADVKVEGRFHGIKSSFSDDVLGLGLNAGVTCEKPINESLGFYLTGGYNFTDNHSHKGDYDLSGPYVGAGFSLKLKN